MPARKAKEGPTIVKKYANRRLYDTGRSSYVTLEDLAELVREGHDFVVQDAKSGEDLTHQVLAQIIVDKESTGPTMLPVPFLRQLISYYGDSLQHLVPDYLQTSFEQFVNNQEQFRTQVNKSLQGMMATPVSTVSAVEEMTRKNMQMFQKAMTAWSPLAQMSGAGLNKNEREAKIKELKDNIAQMQKEVEKLSS